MRAALPPTPANHSHLPRWQALSGRVKPLIVLPPKSMLRLKTATSAVADFTRGSFRPVIGEQEEIDPAAVRQVLICSGKFYYDLAAKRPAEGLTSIAIIPAERLDPRPAGELAAEKPTYPAAR